MPRGIGTFDLEPNTSQLWKLEETRENLWQQAWIEKNICII